MKNTRMSLTTQYVLAFGILLFVANVVLATLILSQSSDAMRELISKDMLDVVNSAAGSLDGDALGALTESDVGGPVFTEIERRLLVFQDSVDIEFIYAVKQLDKDTFVFTVDPDPVDPGAFGEEIIVTPALVSAAAGVPTVDNSPAADRWGNFYSAYSPVFDSKGDVAGIVGIDFDAGWFDSQVQKYTLSITIVSALTVAVGAIVMALITNRVRKRFRELDDELLGLSGNVDQLMDAMASYSGFEAPESKRPSADQEEQSADELAALAGKIRTMQSEMSMYLEYLHEQAYTDALTKAGNSTAYHEIVAELEGKIAKGTAAFCVAVFDINSLKELNDTYGHEYGDLYIQAAARVLIAVYGAEHVYRIGGDEFAVINEDVREDAARLKLADVTATVAAFNADERPCAAVLAISQGASEFAPGEDKAYADVFARADHEMYANKREYYSTVGDRRRAPRS